MIEDVPAFFRPLRDNLATMSSWVDWTAWGAIFTAGALWFLIWEATRAWRLERRRLIAIHAAAGAACHNLYQAYETWARKDAFDAASDEVSFKEFKQSVRYAQKAVARISDADAAYTDLVLEVTILQETLDQLVQALESDDDTVAVDFGICTARVVETVEDLQKAVRRLRGFFWFMKQG